jgi:hypothetical protein
LRCKDAVVRADTPMTGVVWPVVFTRRQTAENRRILCFFANNWVKY